MKLLLLDFETVDEGITLGLGAGWVFATNNLETVRFEIVGWSLSILDTETMEFQEPSYYPMNHCNKLILMKYINSTQGIIAHNITYELGCLEVLEINVENKKLYDTAIIAKLYNNEIEHKAGRSAFSLENLSEVFLTKEQRKAIDILIDSAIENKLVLEPKRKGYSIERFRDKVEKWCYQNMDRLSEEVVGKYCNQDLVATGNLFKLFCEAEK